MSKTDRHIDELSRESYKGDQSWNAKVTVGYELDIPHNNGRKIRHYVIRGTVKRDAYDFQSYLHGEVMTEEAGWKLITSMPMTRDRTNSHSISYTDRNPDRERLFNDCYEMIHQTMRILDRMNGVK